MDQAKRYDQQVQLLVRILNIVDEEKCFALKGGTAINLFIRDMPRLSVDIDLVFLPDLKRDEALKSIQGALIQVAERAQQLFPAANIIRAFESKTDALRLLIGERGVQVKIELSPVLRGVVYEPIRLKVRPKVEQAFGFSENTLVSLADLYGGKICAALDRQHPRDLFDIKGLFEHEGITEDIRKAFLIYLISHPRPAHELLNQRT